MYKHILVAIDGSENSQRVAKEALRLAHLSKNSIIELVYVIDESDLGSVAFRSPESLKNDPVIQQRLYPIESLFEQEGIPYVLTKLQGSPGKAITEYAEEKKADLIMIGSRGLNPIEKLVIGSVSQKVVNHSPCAVLVIK